MAGEFAGKVKFGMVDVDKQDADDKYDWEGLPTTLIIKDGKVAGKVLGADAAAVRDELSKVL